MILAVAPSPSVDVTYVVSTLVEGVQTRPLEVHRVAGGKALNAARAAAAAGAQVVVVAPLGGPGGDLLTTELDRAGIAVRAVASREPTRTCVSIASRATGSLTEIYEHAPPIDDAWAGMLSAVRAELAAAEAPGWLLVSGSIPPTGSDDPLGELSALAAERGVRLAVDTHGTPLRRALELGGALGPALVKVNRAEADDALGAEAGAGAAGLARALHARTGGVAVVTDGEHGAVAVDRSGAWRAGSPPARGAFPVGSGDSMLGALVAALDAGAEVPGALRRASAVAAANALVPGAAVVRDDDVRALVPGIRITAL